MQSSFQFGHTHIWKIKKSIHESNFFDQKKLKKLDQFLKNLKNWKILINDLFCFVCFLINFTSLKTNLFLSIINRWFHITVSYTSQKINHGNRIDCPKYLNKTQALFRHKSHMTAELYWVYILSIQANWKKWKKKTKQPRIHRKYPILQLHI